MPELGASSLGITLFIVGLVFFILIYFLLRMVPRIQPVSKPQPAFAFSSDLPAHDDGVLVIQPGGRVAFVNKTARNWFDLWEDEPNLEGLARHARPSDVFLELCYSEGQARFSLNGRLVEGTSYFLPNGDGTNILLSLRTPQLATLGREEPTQSNLAVDILAELSQTMAANLDLEATLQAILTSVEQLIPADFLEITVWDSDYQHLIPYRFVGLRGLDRHLEKTSERYPIGEGYSGYVAQHREPIIIDDVDANRELRPLIDRKKYPFHSYLGFPLLVGGELIGTLDLTSLSIGAYTQSDLESLKSISGQAAIALHNAILYQEEQHRATELSGLANLVNAVSSIRDSKELFAQLVQGIKPLLDVEIAGFIIYNEGTHKLEAQNPFIGVPPQFVDLYKVEILADSPAETLWHRHETIVTKDAANDPRMVDLGLNGPAMAAGIRGTVLIPIKSGGSSYGYLQAANKSDGTPFDDDDVRLLSIIASQAAPIIENAGLIQQSVQRALRAESLRRIASLSGSVAHIDEVLKYSIIELARLLQADSAAIYLMDEDSGKLNLHAESAYGVSSDDLAQLGGFSSADPNFKHTVTRSKEAFLTPDAQNDQNLISLYQPLVERFKICSAIDVPLISRDRGLGELILSSVRVNFFNRSDVQLAVTIAGQLAIAIERSTLASQTDVDLQRRVNQLTAITRVGRELNTSFELEPLLQKVIDEAILSTQANCGKILLLNPESSDSNQPEILLQIGDPIDDKLHILEETVIKNAQILRINDFNKQAQEPMPPSHDGVRSALISPITYQEKVVGVIHLHGKSVGVFDDAAKQITEALTIQAAIAIGNAQRYQEQIHRNALLNRRLDILANLVETSKNLHLDQPLSQSLEEIAFGIQSSTPFEIALISVYNQEDQKLHRIIGAGIPLETMDELKKHPQPWEAIRNILQPDFKFGRSYYIPYDRRPTLTSSIHTVTVIAGDNGNGDNSQEKWHPKDLLLVPLLKKSGEPVGLISVDAPRDNKRPDSATIETLEIYASQATLVIEGQTQLASLEEKVNKFRSELELSGQAKEEALTLTQKNFESQKTIEQLSQSMERVNAGFGLIEIINLQTDRQTVLSALGQAIVDQMNFDTVLVAEPGISGAQLRNMFGDVPNGVNPEALLGQRNPLSQSIQNGEFIHVADLSAETDWANSNLLSSLESSAFVCIPIIADAKVEATILAISKTPLAHFTTEDELLFDLLGRQTAFVLNNLQLLTETDQRLREVDLLLEFSRQLGGLESTNILNTLAESALDVVRLAQAVTVVLFDASTNKLIPQTAKGYADTNAMLEICYQPGEALLGKVFQNGQPVRIAEVDFAQHYNLVLDDLLNYRKATGGNLPISCLMVPIQSGENRHGVIVLDNFRETDAFTEDDLALVTSLAQQTALTLENVRLYQAAEARAAQLQALSNVASKITSSLEPDELIQTLLEPLEAVVPYNTGTLWLRQGETLSIQSARGFENDDMLIGLETAVEDSRLFSEMIETSLPIVVNDTREDDRFPGIEAIHLSWLGIPLIAKGEVVGAIALEKTESSFYTPDHIQTAITFASQAAVALENANLFQQSIQRAAELDERSQRLALLNRFSNQISSTLDTDYLLSVTAKELQKTVAHSIVSAVLWDNDKAILRTESSSETPSFPYALPTAPIFERLAQSQGVFHTSDISRDPALAPLKDFFAERNTVSLLITPMLSGEILNGFMFMQIDQNHRFTPDEIELARIITNQAAVAVQNASLFAETQRLTAELEQRVAERTEQLGREHQRAQALLRIMQELSVSLDLDHVLNRTLALLNETVGAEQSTILMVRPNEQTFYLRASLGYTTPPPQGGRSTDLNVNEGLASWVINRREGVLIEDLKTDPRWVANNKYPTNHRSAIVVPLLVGAEALGSMLLFHRDPYVFSSDQRELVQAAANQIAISINNAELFNLIREQAESLGSMLRTQQVEASRSTAILEAVADGVLVTDDTNIITLFNESAQQILNLERSEVVGKSLDDFTGLFGGAAETWMETIRTWSRNTESYQPGDSYAERITLDTKRVVSIHLAPVVMRNEFLGTVSIFRDITHQVEVDRLKSEFVATVSHELRTPMTSIKGYVEILLMGAAGALSEQQAQFLQIVKTNTERLNVLVNDLLDVSRIEAGKVVLSFQPLNIRQIIDEVVQEQIHRSGEDKKPMHFETKIPDELPHVEGDIERIRQIIANLVSNAYNYTPAEGQIAIKVLVDEDEIQIDVKDNGIGIPPEDQKRIFERFYRGEDPLVLATAGTGLGLAITQQLIEMHHGRIWMNSEGVPGAGSKFSFTIPLKQPDMLF